MWVCFQCSTDSVQVWQVHYYSQLENQSLSYLEKLWTRCRCVLAKENAMMHLLAVWGPILQRQPLTGKPSLERMRRTLMALHTITQFLWRRLRLGCSRKMWVRFGGGVKSPSGYKAHNDRQSTVDVNWARVLNLFNRYQLPTRTNNYLKTATGLHVWHGGF